MIRLKLVKSLLKPVMVILLLLSVIAIFVSPAVDLQPTALRAVQYASLLFAVLLSAGTVCLALLHFPFGQTSIFVKRYFILAPPPDLLDLNCALLC